MEMLWYYSLVIFLVRTCLVLCNPDSEINAGELKEEEEAEQFLPGVYPTFRHVPRTGFSCLGKLMWNYYADLETGCQVFHICETQYSKLSFLCPIGSVFNQRHLVCDWWYNVECEDSPELYPENISYSIEGEPPIFEGSDLNLESPVETQKKNRQ